MQSTAAPRVRHRQGVSVTRRKPASTAVATPDTSIHNARRRGGRRRAGGAANASGVRTGGA